MPIVVEKIASSDKLLDADLTDLLKIYRDAVPSNNEATKCSATPEDFIHSQRQDDQQTFYAARFNGRLIAAAVVNVDKCLSAVCVRAVTRRRGVAKQFIIEISKQAGSGLTCAIEATDQAMQQLLIKCHFALDQSKSTQDRLLFCQN